DVDVQPMFDLSVGHRRMAAAKKPVVERVPGEKTAKETISPHTAMPILLSSPKFLPVSITNSRASG
ncbi:MAG: hypothetical protein AAGD96_21530, partial [Chloroflexota bacterium]